MDYDEAGVEMQFKSAAAISVTYTLLERCGFEPAGWFDKDDFQAIYNFSTPDAVFALGTAVSDMSREVLRNIERTVKTTIRRRNNERSQHEYASQSLTLLFLLSARLRVAQQIVNMDTATLCMVKYDRSH